MTSGVGERRKNLISDGLGRLRPNFAAATWTKRMRDARPEQFQIVVNLRHRADGGARAFHRVRLLDRDRGRNAANFVDARFVHAIEELPHVRAERFDVAALAFRVNGVESERRFSAPARAGDDGQFSERKIDIDAFEIVLARAANLNTTAFRRRGDATFSTTFEPTGDNSRWRRDSQIFEPKIQVGTALRAVRGNWTFQETSLPKRSVSFSRCAMSSGGMSLPILAKSSP